MASNNSSTSTSNSGIAGILPWIAVALVGAGAVTMIALKRGEQVNAAYVLVAAICSYLIAYRFYSRIISHDIFALDPTRATPAERLEDGRETTYRPTSGLCSGITLQQLPARVHWLAPLWRRSSVFCLAPSGSWLVFVLEEPFRTSLILASSIRRGGKSLGQMAREEIGPVAGVTALVAVLGIMIILISVLALVVVNALKGSPWGTVTIGLTIPIAMLMGVYLKYLRPNRVLEATAIGLVLLGFALEAGRLVSQSATLAPMFTLQGTTLAWTIMGYGFAASVMPVWLLLAPRDYLSAFVKIGVVIALGAGILIVLPPIQMPAVTQFIDGTGPIFSGKVFPFVFVTIACGAISGFHALISSGTTPKLLKRESDARFIGYGAMLTESLVAIMALIAACVLTPGVFFAINAPVAALGTTAASAAQAIAQWGFVVTPAELESLARQVGESSLLSRTGGAPSLAVGMAYLFKQVLGGDEMMALWYHFAIMFEALFILTTLDAGTRVGRFMLQDLLGRVYEPLGRISWYPAVLVTSAMFVSCWGYFLYQGVTDPYGGINSLWPLFGISNQLLATVALCVGTTVIIKMGKAKYAFVTMLPLAWLVIVTMTAGAQKIFSPLPRLGFLSHANMVREVVASGAFTDEVKNAAVGTRLIFNDRVDAAVAAFFMIAVIVILLDSAREWIAVTSGRKAAVTSEDPYVMTQLAEG